MCTTAWGNAQSTLFISNYVQQGRKCLFIYYYCFGTLLGANAGESVQNLYDWLDTLILRFCTDDVLVYRCDGTRMWGWYRGIVGKSHTKIIL